MPPWTSFPTITKSFSLVCSLWRPLQKGAVKTKIQHLSCYISFTFNTYVLVCSLGDAAAPSEPLLLTTL